MAKSGEIKVVDAAVVETVVAAVPVSSNVQVDVPVPVVEVEKVEFAPVIEPTSIKPNLGFEVTDAANEVEAPTVLLTKDSSARMVVITTDAKLGSKLLTRGDITDEEEYVRLLETARGRELVRAI